jgi:hypothetical protein
LLLETAIPIDPAELVVSSIAGPKAETITDPTATRLVASFIVEKFA